MSTPQDVPMTYRWYLSCKTCKVIMDVHMNPLQSPATFQNPATHIDPQTVKCPNGHEHTYTKGDYQYGGGVGIKVVINRPARL